MEINGRQQELDFIKGVAIMSVILLHSLGSSTLDSIYYSIHIGQAVPLFIFITFLLSFKYLKNNGDVRWFSSNRLRKLFKRIVFPILLINTIQIIISYVIMGGRSVIHNMIRDGGLGPGSYYIWVYLQLWMLIPIIYRILNIHRYLGILIISLVCVILNILISYAGFSDNIYRLLCSRYIFLSVIAWLFLMKYNESILRILGILSLLYIVFFSKNNLIPFVYNGGWSYQNYPSYFWTLLLFTLLWRTYEKISCTHCKKSLLWLGRNSWGVFVL